MSTLTIELRQGSLPEAENALSEILDLIADAMAERLLEEVKAGGRTVEPDPGGSEPSHSPDLGEEGR